MITDPVYASILTTETADVRENRDPEDEGTAAMALTTLKESDTGEGDRDEDDIFSPCALADAALPFMVTTCTKAGGEEEQDEEEQYLLFAVSTTSTSNIGEQESDPEEDSFAISGQGSIRPLAYRFGEKANSINPNVCYDASTQTHMLADGRIAVSAIKERMRDIS